MKTDISEFKSQEELNEFFENPVIQREIELEKDTTRKREWKNMLRLMVEENIKVNKITGLNITYSSDKPLRFDISYKEDF